jgi:hypothetical protein
VIAVDAAAVTVTRLVVGQLGVSVERMARRFLLRGISQAGGATGAEVTSAEVTAYLS